MTPTDIYLKSRIAIRYWLLGRGHLMAVRAMDLAAGYHIGVRKDKVTPEFAHQVAIVNYLRTLEPSLRHPDATFAVGFLHDVPEDYHLSLEVVGAEFTPQIRESVWRLTKVFGGTKKDPVAYFDAIAEDPIASIVKGGDRVHNQQSMPGVFSETKQREYITESQDFIIPMLKVARRRFPDQEPAYENLKHLLRSQISLLENALPRTAGLTSV
jgi:(p)ppGpp synthase/HD superfamily hydrolase